MSPSIREPIVANAFYPGSPTALSTELSRLFAHPRIPEGRLPSPMGVVVPHAGYVYSGAVAAAAYSELAQSGRPDWAIVLGANHTGRGGTISLACKGAWRTPLGSAPIATEVAGKLIGAGVTVTDEAFQHEHSIEVQLPFLQFLFGEGIPFVPICVMLPPLSAVTALGEAIARAVDAEAGVVIASSDLTHYEPDDIARRTDRRSIDRILALDLKGFYQSLIKEQLSICGGGAIAVLIACARALGWRRTKLLSYATSGDMSGERSAVVGYAAISFNRREDG
ncbi:AmmeMemoRadiSam system protein B [Candidatus Bipolaricaulota bacterium]|nr:AmmeMemoRadiSam system protein B [Candidatus Bipolaricaulota bacterium]